MSADQGVAFPQFGGAFSGRRIGAALRPVRPFFRPRRILTMMLATASIFGLSAGLAAGEPAKPTAPAAQLSNEQLLRNFQCMEQRLRLLEGQLKAQAAAPTAGTEPPPESTQSTAPESPKPFPMRYVQGHKRD